MSFGYIFQSVYSENEDKIALKIKQRRYSMITLSASVVIVNGT